jgi:hypothetical protein
MVLRFCAVVQHQFLFMHRLVVGRILLLQFHQVTSAMIRGNFSG